MKVTDPRYGAVGDGTDETDKIQRCVRENEVVEFPPPPAGVGYGFDPAKNGPIRIPSNRTLRGTGGTLLRLGLFRTGMTGFVNDTVDTGSSDITFDSLLIDGRKSRVTLVEDSNSVCLRVYSTNGGSFSSRINVLNCTISNWPGTCVRFHSVRDCVWKDNGFLYPHRAGFVGGLACDNIRVEGNRVYQTGDDCVAFNGSEASSSPLNGPAANIVIIGNRLEMRKPQNGGCPVALRGGAGTLVQNNVTRNGVQAGIYATGNWYGIPCRDIRVLGNDVRGSQSEGIEYRSVRGGEIRNNTAVGNAGKQIAWPDSTGIVVSGNGTA